MTTENGKRKIKSKKWREAIDNGQLFWRPLDDGSGQFINSADNETESDGVGNEITIKINNPPKTVNELINSIKKENSTKIYNEVRTINNQDDRMRMFKKKVYKYLGEINYLSEEEKKKLNKHINTIFSTMEPKFG